MGRLIDEDAVKRRMHETMDYQDLYLPVHFEMCMNDAPTVEPASPWHRVEEPPKQYGAFAVACVYDGKFYWCKGIYLDGKWLREGNGIEIPADYWMPIEPPKEDA